MIEITKPVEPSLVIALKGDDVQRFMEMMYDMVHGNLDSYDDTFASELWMVL